MLFSISMLTQAISEPFHLLGQHHGKNSVIVTKVFENFKSRVACICYGYKCFAMVKQTKLEKLSRQFSRVREVLASYIAETIEIPVNRVRLIPTDLSIPGKIYKKRLGTLHSFVPGDVYVKNVKYKDLYFKQSLKKLISDEKRGFTRNIIRSMSVHPDLPRIIALDTFIGNVDRSKRNLFYNKRTDKFWGIDLEQSFRSPLSQQTADFFSNMLNKPETDLSLDEIKALKIYRLSLKKLLIQNPIVKQHRWFGNLLNKAGFILNGSNNINDKQLAICIDDHKKWVEQNYAYIHKIVDQLKQLIKINKECT